MRGILRGQALLCSQIPVLLSSFRGAPTRKRATRKGMKMSKVKTRSGMRNDPNFIRANVPCVGDEEVLSKSGRRCGDGW